MIFFFDFRIKVFLIFCKSKRVFFYFYWNIFGFFLGLLWEIFLVKIWYGFYKEKDCINFSFVLILLVLLVSFLF